MRIKRLELQGFKSFVEPTVFQFGPGISAVVGPNGCGKSNVIDAIRWTLGEQSPSTLRGRAMSDVIFAGSEGRAPANHAQVSLVFDNTDESFGGRYRRFAEIEVTRRLDRSGGSTYSINRKRCRLKDVTELFVDTGVGARAYSIIEQGRVGFVVNARPDERRVLIDEVAGINRFKSQRVEAERRMEQTRANLLRVADLVGEMGRQREALGAQAETARAFLDLRRQWKEASLHAALAEAVLGVEEQRELKRRTEALAADLERAAAGAREAEAARELATDALNSAREALSEHRSELRAVSARLDSAQREGGARSEEIEELRQRIQRLEGESDELSTQAKSLAAKQADAAKQAEDATGRLAEARAAQATALAREESARSDAQAAHARVEEAKQRLLGAMTEAARHRNAIALLTRRVEDAREEIAGEQRADEEDGARLEAARARLAEAIASLDERAARRGAAVQRRAEAEQAEKAAERAQREARKEVDAAERARASLAARLDAEEQLVASLEGAEPGLKALVDHVAATPALASGFVGVVADLVDVPAGREAEIELALGDRIEAAVFSDRDALRAAVRWMLEQDAGRATLLLLDPDASATGDDLASSLDATDPLTRQLLGGIRRVDSVDALLDGGDRLLLPAARILDGAIEVGRRSEGGHLARRTRVRELTEALAVSDTERSALQEQADRAEASLREARLARQVAASGVHEAELEELAGRRDRDEAQRGVASAEGEQQRARERRERLEATLERLTAELQRARAANTEAEAAHEALERELAGLRDGVGERDRLATEAAREATAARVRLAEVRQEAAALERDARRIEEELEGVRSRSRRAQEEVGRAARRLETLLSRRGALDEERGELAQRQTTLQSATEGLEAALATAEAGEKQARALEAEARSGRDRVGTEAARVERDIARLEARLEALARSGAAELDLDLLALAPKLLDGQRVEVSVTSSPGHPPLLFSLERADLPERPQTAAKQAERLLAKADALGAVNLAAATEYEEIDGRWQELNSQQDDLEAALADLVRAIARIEKETRSRFREAFDAVAKRFAAIYPRLVGGGRAELSLTEPDALLTTGIEIRVEPPGKRLQNLQLLSGGEKAMAAIALVFAIFEVKPSPFCLLDEVDAPLDEANSRRFNGMLGELSTGTQFLVITHNRTTMEVADVLYGVTMQTPGVSSVVAVSMEEAGSAATIAAPEEGEEVPT